MAVGFKVKYYWYQIGNGDFLHSFFSTVAYHLENKSWGSRFPLLMNELYQGKLDKTNINKAIDELDTIQTELQRFSEIPQSQTCRIQRGSYGSAVGRSFPFWSCSYR